VNVHLEALGEAALLKYNITSVELAMEEKRPPAACRRPAPTRPG